MRNYIAIIIDKFIKINNKNMKNIINIRIKYSLTKDNARSIIKTERLTIKSQALK
jgi:hypothetical protein